MDGMPDAAAGPTFATCVGLLRYACGHRADEPDYGLGVTAEPEGRMGRIGQWLRENF